MDNHGKVSRRKFVGCAAAGGLAIAGGYVYSLLNRPHAPAYPPGCGDVPEGFPASVSPGAPRPNIVIINADDLGYGDLSCYGSRAISTPNIDAMAGQGVRFTDFHTCDAVCTPSRAGLLTGRYPARMMLDTPLHPGHVKPMKKVMNRIGYAAGKIGLMDLATSAASHGLSGCEFTVAEALRAGGYRTAMLGKWHLGDYNYDPEYNPVNHGFDYYFGVPYSNDMTPFPLYRNLEKLEDNIEDMSKLTGLYTEEAEKFIAAATDGKEPGKPFFLYFAHTFPHRPLHSSEKFTGRSKGGLFGDVVEEIDWSVGRVLAALEKAGAADNTLVIFTSDNGPWYQGSPGGLRGRKGQSFEGGHRVPFIARWPENIPAGGVSEATAMNIDLMPTALALAGLTLPTDRIIDGTDITAQLTGKSAAPSHEYFYFYHHGDLEGIRSGKWKYFRSVNHYTWPMPNNKVLGHLSNHTTGPLPLLHNMETDPGEAYNMAERFPDIVKKLDAAMTDWQTAMAKNPLGFK